MLRSTIANHPVCFELRFQATGEGGLINALERATAVEYTEWRDAWREWSMGESKDRSPFLVQAMKPQEWRLTSQGELARDDLQDPNPAVFNYVLERDIFGPGYWLRRQMNGRPLSAEEQAYVARQIAAGHDLSCLSRPAVAGSGQLLEHRKVETTNAAQAVSLTNWNEGASAFAEAFGKLLGTTIVASNKAPEAEDERAVDHRQQSTPTSPTSDGGPSEAPTVFRGGELVYQPDRVTLCGVEICSGLRSQTRRRILELLGQKQTDGRFIAYSGETLAEILGDEASNGTENGAIRDLRKFISEALRQANFIMWSHGCDSQRRSRIPLCRLHKCPRCRGANDHRRHRQ